MKCPLCDGTGEWASRCNDRQARVLALIDHDFTYREIMKIEKIKSTSTIDYYVNKRKGTKRSKRHDKCTVAR